MVLTRACMQRPRWIVLIGKLIHIETKAFYDTCTYKGEQP